MTNHEKPTCIDDVPSQKKNSGLSKVNSDMQSDKVTPLDPLIGQRQRGQHCFQNPVYSCSQCQKDIVTY